MQTPKKKPAPAEPKVVKYDSLRALKIAKSRKMLPRALKAEITFDGDEDVLSFRRPGQTEPVLSLNLVDYAKACLKSDGFKLA